MDQRTRTLLEEGVGTAVHRTVDITTTGAKTGRPRRIEIWIYRSGDAWYLTGRPAARDWYANLQRDPHLTVHLKDHTRADLDATARLITDPAERRQVLEDIMAGLNRMDRPGVPRFDLDEWVTGSPLAELTFPEATND